MSDADAAPTCPACGAELRRDLASHVARCPRCAATAPRRRPPLLTVLIVLLMIVLLIIWGVGRYTPSSSVTGPNPDASLDLPQGVAPQPTHQQPVSPNPFPGAPARLPE